MPFGDRQFDLGVNLGWLNRAYGHDLGVNPWFAGPFPHPDWGVAWSGDLVRAYFADIAARGCTVVRVWAFEELEGLLFDPARFDPVMLVGQKQGSVAVRDNHANYERYNIPRVTGLQKIFKENVAQMMHIALVTDLEIHWTILSSSTYFTSPHAHHAWALRRMLEDKDCRNSFIASGLIPFLEILRPFPNVYAIDLINEPEGFSYKHRWRKIVPLNSLQGFVSDYIRDASNAVHGSFKHLNVSVGFRSRETIDTNLPALDPLLDFFDFHHYGEDGLSKDPIVSSAKPTILGEVGYRSERGDFLPDNEQQQSVIDRVIGEAIERQFRGCFVWRYAPCATSNDSNNLLIDTGGDLCRDDEQAREAFLSSFRQNSRAHWRPVCSVIERRGQQIALLNGTRRQA